MLQFFDLDILECAEADFMRVYIDEGYDISFRTVNYDVVHKIQGFQKEFELWCAQKPEHRWQKSTTVLYNFPYSDADKMAFMESGDYEDIWSYHVNPTITYIPYDATADEIYYVLWYCMRYCRKLTYEQSVILDSKIGNGKCAIDFELIRKMYQRWQNRIEVRANAISSGVVKQLNLAA